MPKIIAENDLLQLVVGPDGRPAQHTLMVLDSRGVALLEFAKMWGTGGSFAQAMEDQQPHNRGNGSSALILRAAEVIDAAWDEARRRGWVLTLPGFAPDPD